MLTFIYERMVISNVYTNDPKI